MTTIEERLADLKALQENNESTVCPRCGRETMKKPLSHNALSRLADSGLPNGHGGRTGGIPGVSISGSLVRALPVNRRPYPDRTGTVHHDPPIRGKSGRKDSL